MTAGVPNRDMAAAQTCIFAGHAGRVLRADIGGPPDARGVILLHGGGQTRHAWQRTMQKLLERGYRVLAYDLRGHGESEWAGQEGYTLDAQVGDLRAAMELFSQPPVLVGASFGGLIAMVGSGERVIEPTGLVLVDVTANVNRRGEERILRFMQAHVDGFASIDEAAVAIASYLPHRPRRANTDGLKRNLRKRGGRWFWHWDPKLFDSLDAAGVQAQPRLEAAATALTVPTLLVRGALSELVDEARVAEFNGLVPHARCVDVRNAHHMVAGDNNDAFSSALLEFIAEISAASGD